MNYYSFLISTKDNEIKVAKLESEDGTVEGTGLLDENGNSTHPSIRNFISKQGISLDPPVGNIPFSYLYNFTSTDGCSLIQDTFVASAHNLSFLPDTIKNLYEPEVTFNKIQFITPNSGTFTIVDRPGRIIDYTRPDQGSIGEDYVYDKIIDGSSTNFSSTVLVDTLQPKIKEYHCSFQQYIEFLVTSDCRIRATLTIDRYLWELCKKCNDEDPVPPNKEFNCRRTGDQSKNIFQLPPGDSLETTELYYFIPTNETHRYSKTYGMCYEDSHHVRQTITWDLGGPPGTYHGSGMQGSMELGTTSGLPNSWSSVIDAPGFGLSFIEAAVGTVAKLNPVGAASDMAGGVITAASAVGAVDQATAGTASDYTDPIGKGVTWVFDGIRGYWSDTISSVSDNLFQEFFNIREKCVRSGAGDCAKCIKNEINASITNKNSTISKNLNKLANNSIRSCC